MTGHARFKETGKESFFGEFLYERVVPREHFLRQLEALIAWERFTKRLLKWYQGQAVRGRPPYDPAMMLKMLLLSYLYGLSERQTESVVNDSLSMKWFLGLGVDEAAPDHSTLSDFKVRMLENGKGEALQELLEEVVHGALEAGIEFGTIQVMDSVHTVADVNTAKDEGRKRGGKRPRDGSARWGVKHSKRFKDESGKQVVQKEYFYGYKAHVSMNAGTDLITSLKVTAGNAPDGKQLPDLVTHDLALGLPTETVSADRGYDDGENHELLWFNGLHSAIRLNRYRTRKKDKNKGLWLALRETPEYQMGQKVRFTIERKFGEAKQSHGLARCRYVGLLRYALQATLTAMALNLKRMVKLLTGVSFKGRATTAA